MYRIRVNTNVTFGFKKPGGRKVFREEFSTGLKEWYEVGDAGYEQLKNAGVILDSEKLPDNDNGGGNDNDDGGSAEDNPPGQTE